MHNSSLNLFILHLVNTLTMILVDAVINFIFNM